MNQSNIKFMPHLRGTAVVYIWFISLKSDINPINLHALNRYVFRIVEWEKKMFCLLVIHRWSLSGFCLHTARRNCSSVRECAVYVGRKKSQRKNKINPYIKHIKITANKRQNVSSCSGRFSGRDVVWKKVCHFKCTLCWIVKGKIFWEFPLDQPWERFSRNLPFTCTPQDICLPLTLPHWLKSEMKKVRFAEKYNLLFRNLIYISRAGSTKW